MIIAIFIFVYLLTNFHNEGYLLSRGKFFIINDMKNYCLNKRYFLLLRIISALAACVLFIATFINCVSGEILRNFEDNKIEILFGIITNILFFFTFIFFTIRPQFFFLTSIISLFYSFSCSVNSSPTYMMSLFMFFLTVSILLAFGFFEKKTFLKISITIFVFLVERMLPLMHGYENFVISMIQTMGFSLVYGISVIFIVIYINSKNMEEKPDRKDSEKHEFLNLADYNGIERSDSDLLKLVQQGKSYAEIAAAVRSTEGTMKNTFADLYKKLGVKNKKEFLIKFGQAKIVWKSDI